MLLNTTLGLFLLWHILQAGFVYSSIGFDLNCKSESGSYQSEEPFLIIDNDCLGAWIMWRGAFLDARTGKADKSSDEKQAKAHALTAVLEDLYI